MNALTGVLLFSYFQEIIPLFLLAVWSCCEFIARSSLACCETTGTCRGNNQEKHQVDHGCKSWNTGVEEGKCFQIYCLKRIWEMEMNTLALPMLNGVMELRSIRVQIMVWCQTARNYYLTFKCIFMKTNLCFDSNSTEVCFLGSKWQHVIIDLG